MVDNNETSRGRSSWRDLFRAIGEAGAVTGVVDPDPDWSSPAPLHRVLQNDLGGRTVHEGPSASGRDISPARNAKSSNPVTRPPCFQSREEEDGLDRGHYENAA